MYNILEYGDDIYCKAKQYIVKAVLVYENSKPSKYCHGRIKW